MASTPDGRNIDLLKGVRVLIVEDTWHVAIFERPPSARVDRVVVQAMRLHLPADLSAAVTDKYQAPSAFEQVTEAVGIGPGLAFGCEHIDRFDFELRRHRASALYRFAEADRFRVADPIVAKRTRVPLGT